MKRSKEDAEYSIIGTFKTKSVDISVSMWPKIAAKCEARYGKPVEVWKSKDGEVVTAFWKKLPLKVISFRKIKPKQEKPGKAPKLKKGISAKATKKVAKKGHKK